MNQMNENPVSVADETVLARRRRADRNRRSWTLVLAGPVVGYTYFWAVYLLAEASCAEQIGRDEFTSSALRALILVAAVTGVVVLVVAARRARASTRAAPDLSAPDTVTDERDSNRRFMADTGLLLLGMFALFVVMIAAPVIGMTLC